MFGLRPKLSPFYAPFVSIEQLCYYRVEELVYVALTFKNGTKQNVERAIAMNLTLDDIFESLVCHVVQLISPLMHGFRKSKSVTTNLIGSTRQLPTRRRAQGCFSITDWQIERAGASVLTKGVASNYFGRICRISDLPQDKGLAPSGVT